MSKKQKTLVQRAKELVEEVKRTHVHSMSKIYGMYNEITGKSEVPQSCPSCLVRKVNFIESWVATEEKRLASVVPTLDKEEKEEEV
jgi:hypothetical protein